MSGVPESSADWLGQEEGILESEPDPVTAGEVVTEIELIRSTEEEKAQQIENVRGWQQSRNVLAPVGETEHGHVVEDDAAAATEPHDGHGLGYLQKTARERKNVFAALMEAKTHGLRQINRKLYDAVGAYRRNKSSEPTASDGGESEK